MTDEAALDVAVELVEEVVLLFVGEEEPDDVLPPLDPPEPAVALDPPAVAVAVPVLVPDPELGVATNDPLPVEVDDAVLDCGRRLEGSVTLEQERSYNGWVPMLPSLVLLPKRPKDGFGIAGAASWSTYHQVLTFPNEDAQPTWS